MSRRIGFWFAPWLLVAVGAAGCGDESGSDAPASTDGPPGSAAGGGATTPATPSGGGGVAQPGGNETPNAGLDGAPVVGNEPGPTGSAGDAAGAGGMPGDGAMGGAAPAGGTTGTGGAGLTGEVGSPFPSSVTRPRIMIIGDSISAGQGCYKKYLLAELNNSGFSNFDFVGEYTDDCGGGVMHSARSCSTAQQYTQPMFTLAAGSCNPSGEFPGMSPLMAEHQPDLVMIQLGVNDVWSSTAIESILASYTTLVEQARAQNADVVIAMAQIHKIRPTGADGDAVFARAQQLVAAVPAWAMAQSQPQSPIFVADLWTNSDPAQSNDGVHPDDAGAQLMAHNWFEAVRNILTAD